MRKKVGVCNKPTAGLTLSNQPLAYFHGVETEIYCFTTRAMCVPLQSVIRRKYMPSGKVRNDKPVVPCVLSTVRPVWSITSIVADGSMSLMFSSPLVGLG